MNSSETRISLFTVRMRKTFKSQTRNGQQIKHTSNPNSTPFQISIHCLQKHRNSPTNLLVFPTISCKRIHRIYELFIIHFVKRNASARCYKGEYFITEYLHLKKSTEYGYYDTIAVPFKETQPWKTLYFV